MAYAPVHHSVRLVMEMYKPARVKHLGGWSDGCGAQFKSRTPLLGFTLLQQEFAAAGVQLTWSYYGSQRGKCVA